MDAHINLEKQDFSCGNESRRNFACGTQHLIDTAYRHRYLLRPEHAEVPGKLANIRLLYTLPKRGWSYMPSDPNEPRAHGKDASGQKRKSAVGSSVTALGTMGTELGLVVAVLALIGYWLDGRWDTAPWMLITGAFIGIVGGMYRFVRQAKKFFSDG